MKSETRCAHCAEDCPSCKKPITGVYTTINGVEHHIACANRKWREWFGVDLVPQRATA